MGGEGEELYSTYIYLVYNLQPSLWPYEIEKKGKVATFPNLNPLLESNKG